jgi:hypothetical protein
MKGKEEHLQEISIPLEEIYRTAIVMLPFIVLIYLIPFLILWLRPFIENVTEFSLFRSGILNILRHFLMGIAALTAGIVLHELLHAAGWLPFTKHGFRSVRFGILSREMAPYAHCTESLPVNGYRTGIMLPSLILGFFPAFYGMVTGSFGWLCYGTFFTWAASGDLIMFWKIRKLKSSTMVTDHHEKVGCFVSGRGDM